jgi:TM2 domain-containing membrane protein YozV
MKEEDWLRAATEYRRSLLCEPDVETADTLTLRLGVCLRRGGEPDRAVDALRRMLDGAGRKDLSRVAVREIALAYYGSGRPGEGARFLEKLRADDPSLFLASGGPHLLGVGSLFQGAWAEAHEAFRVGAADASWPGEAALRDLDAISLQGMRLDRKSPALAACLSAVVPGAGKAYAGRFRDGLYSLLTVGVTLWQSIDGFSDGGADSGRGWIYGTLSTGFYMGNVYGSAVAARIRNERSEVDLQERAAAAAFEAGSP